MWVLYNLVYTFTIPNLKPKEHNCCKYGLAYKAYFNIFLNNQWAKEVFTEYLLINIIKR